MKKVILAYIALVVLGIAWTLYLEHEKERFEKSLPQVPQVLAPQYPRFSRIFKMSKIHRIFVAVRAGSGDPALQRGTAPVVRDRLKVWHKCQTFANMSGSGDLAL